MGLFKKENFMFNRQTMSLIIAILIVTFAVADLPQTTNLALAHFGDHTDDEHTFPSFDMQIVRWGVTFNLSCTSFFPDAPDHPWWAPPVKVCFPGIDEVAIPNGCLAITWCLGTAECTGTICPPDDDDDDDDSSGNN